MVLTEEGYRSCVCITAASHRTSVEYSGVQSGRHLPVTGCFYSANHDCCLFASHTVNFVRLRSFFFHAIQSNSFILSRETIPTINCRLSFILKLTQTVAARIPTKNSSQYVFRTYHQDRSIRSSCRSCRRRSRCSGWDEGSSYGHEEVEWNVQPAPSVQEGKRPLSSSCSSHKARYVGLLGVDIVGYFCVLSCCLHLMTYSHTILSCILVPLNHLLVLYTTTFDCWFELWNNRSVEQNTNANAPNFCCSSYFHSSSSHNCWNKQEIGWCSCVGITHWESSIRSRSIGSKRLVSIVWNIGPPFYFCTSYY